MTTHEFTDCILQTATGNCNPAPFDEAEVCESAQLISGSFTMPLYASLLRSGYNSDEVTAHLEKLYDSGQHTGLVYFVFLLADAVDFSLPTEFSQMLLDGRFVPLMAAAIIEDWLEYDVEDFACAEV